MMTPGQMLSEGFHLQIGLTEIHVPRMWVENDTDDSDHRVRNSLNVELSILNS